MQTWVSLGGSLDRFSSVTLLLFKRCDVRKIHHVYHKKHVQSPWRGWLGYADSALLPNGRGEESKSNLRIYNRLRQIRTNHMTCSLMEEDDWLPQKYLFQVVYSLPLFSDGWFLYWPFLNFSSQGCLTSCRFCSSFFVINNGGRGSCHKSCFFHTWHSWFRVLCHVKPLNRLKRK